ncbi:MAG: transcriptional regulator [Bacillaceae bacterium G1]|nr:transcriptional regulator [Bacillota bacterium]OJF18010.1 MAG: transcriptional regulator [Bacillaceae bacterium G1]
MVIELSERQEKILEIVKNKGPITGEQIAEALQLTRATLRPDLAILTMAGYLDARPRVGYFYVGRSNNSLIAEEMRKMRVGDYKAVPVMVEETTSAYEAIVTMFVQDVGTLFVTKKDGNLAGVISRKDLLRSAMGKQPLQDIPVSIIMTRMPNLITCTPDETLLDAAKKLIENQVDALPVVKPVKTEDGKEKLEVIGRITKTTITRAFVELGQEKSV